MSNHTLTSINTSPDLRQWPDIRQTLYATHLFGFLAFFQLGMITHRNSAKGWILRDRQNIILPLVFCFFPLLYVCQVVVAFPLALRNVLSRPWQGVQYYLCATLGMYAVRTEFTDHTGNHDDTAKRCGPALLMDCFKPRAHPSTQTWSQRRVLDLFVTLLSLFQATSTSLLYVRRYALHPEALLMIDHRTGMMAIGAAAVSLSNAFFELTGYDWEDTLCASADSKLEDYRKGSLHKFHDGELDLEGTINSTNKHVYDCALALLAHLVHFRWCARYFPLFERTGATTATSAIILPSIIALLIAISLLAHVFWPMEPRASRLTYRVIPKGDKMIRIIMLVVVLYVAAATLASEIREVGQVMDRNMTSSLNADWAWKDSWAAFLWSL